MTEHDWRKSHEKKADKLVKATEPRASDWKQHREAPKAKGSAHASKAAWIKMQAPGVR